VTTALLLPRGPVSAGQALPSVLDTFSVLYPQLQGIDLRT
jgi:hypothetical protein